MCSQAWLTRKVTEGRQKGLEAVNLAESWGKSISGRWHSKGGGLRQKAAHRVQGREAMRLEPSGSLTQVVPWFPATEAGIPCIQALLEGGLSPKAGPPLRLRR